ncbi:MAG: ribosomal protein S18-alanine N-acetyltransferase [Holosporaceae bacterium]|jgi:ribosomal-protein-alanine N-acetyltransferase|nr:ribosomal protein S18-alanine N-acetyltransferase [Holosporaceae bacterium]
MIFEICDITNDCAATLSQLHAACFSDHWDESYFRNLSADFYGFMANCGVKNCGFILCRRVIDEAEILTMCVLSEYRNRSLGTQLLEKVLKYSSSLLVKKIFLEVADNNLPAVALYKRCGFEEVARRQNYYQSAGIPTDARVMQCLL